MPIVIVLAGDELAFDRLEETLNHDPQLGAITPITPILAQDCPVNV